MKVNLNVTYYYIINMDLKMSKGKIAAQVSHVAMMLGEKYRTVGRAIILKGNEKTIRKLMAFPYVEFIADAGLTEVPADSVTCVGFKKGCNYPSNVAFDELKLL